MLLDPQNLSEKEILKLADVDPEFAKARLQSTAPFSMAVLMNCRFWMASTQQKSADRWTIMY